MPKPSKLIISILFVLLIIGLDQTSKQLVLHYLPKLVFINMHGVLGILPGWVGYVALGVLLISLKKKVLGSFWLLLIVAAGLSNILDRLLYGGVVDFIQIWQFPVFNLADSLITIGVIAISLKEFKQEKTESIKEK
ncbi:hypothetical protein GYA49_02700 [Candidatus Beckwithbacteria bacterium]|nr:hypothetical protein [Candidatus Beckwithbacteria bacterium]